ncbi:MAG: prepilin-type N-terminal cleavage/methylation domain-containing protein [Erysipelotrichaceae bacterium]|nr:prepilin-type N-terminal cleavage/methylation domain-containing protein [Erysipelotrichaceae bacterium]
MKKDAFTLLEMIVVVMIVSVLFLLTLPNVTKVMDAVDSKACNALTKVADTAVVQYKLDYGRNPGSIDDLVNAGYLTAEQTTCSNGSHLYLADGHAQAH